MAIAVDITRIAFLGAMTFYTVQMMQKMGNYQMTIVDLPMNIVYSVVLFGFAAMTLRSVVGGQAALAAWVHGAREAGIDDG